MRIRWRGLELPSTVQLDESVSTPRYGLFVIEPFERGFGTTIGNSLRRVLLSSIEGAAVCSVKIAGAAHEFMSLPGVFQDVTDIILNIKGLVVKCDSSERKTIKVERKGKGDVTGGDIVCDPSVEIINKDHVIATLTDDVEFQAELTVSSGRGYVTAVENAERENEIGVIPVDSVYSPVVRVRFRTEDTRVGQRTNYDRLNLEIWTDGTISPDDVLVEASKILRKHLNPFVHYLQLGEDTIQSAPAHEADGGTHKMDNAMQSILAKPIAELEFSVRASNCLDAAKIRTVGELCRLTEGDMLRLRSFGKTSLREVRRKLGEMGLGLGMMFESQDSADGGESGSVPENPHELSVPADHN